MTIYLCGFLGCGKSTIGKLLAQKTGLKFTDLDDYIEETEKMSIPEIFASKGESYFREKEAKAVKDKAEAKEAEKIRREKAEMERAMAEQEEERQAKDALDELVREIEEKGKNARFKPKVMTYNDLTQTAEPYKSEEPDEEEPDEFDEPEIPEEISEDEAAPEEEPVIPEESAGGEQPETDPEAPLQIH